MLPRLTNVTIDRAHKTQSEDTFQRLRTNPTIGRNAACRSVMKLHHSYPAAAASACMHVSVQRMRVAIIDCILALIPAPPSALVAHLRLGWWAVCFSFYDCQPPHFQRSQVINQNCLNRSRALHKRPAAVYRCGHSICPLHSP